MSDLPAIKKPRKQQIREPVERAIQLIVTRGVTIAEAAEAVGMKPRSLTIALKKDHVSRRIQDVKRAWLESRTFKSWVGVADLADNAQSEDVRLKAHRLVLEAAGELSGDKNRDAPRATQLVQILLQGGAQPVVTVGTSGVIEAAPLEAMDDD